MQPGEVSAAPDLLLRYVHICPAPALSVAKENLQALPGDVVGLCCRSALWQGVCQACFFNGAEHYSLCCFTEEEQNHGTQQEIPALGCPGPSQAADVGFGSAHSHSQGRNIPSPMASCVYDSRCVLEDSFLCLTALRLMWNIESPV